MPSEVLYRKWRPQRFADVSGQDVPKRTLLNALRNGNVSHAYLFAGPRGTGKTTMGRLLTKAINCERNAASAAERDGEPCNQCASCLAYNEGRALDLVELDGASNRGIDDVRKLRDNVGFAPMAGAGAHKVYLIDEVHMLTDPAFNALLKTLEEPPPHVVFILATTDVHRVPATIVSRCQRLDFTRIPTSAIADRLAQIAEAEGIRAPRPGLELIARAATGSLRDAINLLEQLRDSHGADLAIDAIREGLGLIGDERAAALARQALAGDLGASLATIGSVRDDGLDLRQFQRQTVAHLRDLMLVQAGAQPEGALTAEQLEEMRGVTESTPRESLVRLLRLLSEADLRLDPLSPLPLELAIAEALSAPRRGAPVAEDRPQTQARPAPPSARPPQRAPDARAGSPAAPRQRPPDAVPSELRRENVTGASPEEIARLVGSKAPVIPPAREDDEPAANGAVVSAPPVTVNGELDLAGLVMKQLYPLVKSKNPGAAAFLNGSCHAVSWQDGVLTLGVYAEFHKGKIEQPANRAVYEEVAAAILGAPVSVRCIMAARPARALNKNPLVQHAVEQHGARIISTDQE
jgi:DNA polymerase-3 subunit gamma/tau